MAGKPPIAQVLERKRFMLEIFKRNPDMSAAKANALHFEQFGEKMRPQGVYEMRDRALAGEDIEIPVPKTRDARERLNTYLRAEPMIAKNRYSAPAGAMSVKQPRRQVRTAPQARARTGSEVREVQAPAGGGRTRTQMFAVVTATPQELEFLHRVLDKLQEVGLANLMAQGADNNIVVIAGV